MSRDQVAASLAESVRLGVKEYYFTGGERFMNRDMLGILEDTLQIGPATVLTNATLLPQRVVDRLAELSRASRYTLELRVSIDGVTADMNDAIRGPGSFDRAVAAVGRLVAAASFQSSRRRSRGLIMKLTACSRTSTRYSLTSAMTGRA